VIVTQDQCAVCAASLGDLEAALGAWTGVTPKVVSLSPATLGDVWLSFSQVAAALGAPERGHALATELANRISEVAQRAQRLQPRPRVACVEWLDPLMAAGNWVPELVTLAGGEPLLASPGAHSDWLAADALAEADPDRIVVMPCGFDLTRTRAELASVVQESRWQGLRAVRDGRLAVVDGNQYFNRPGPRLVESLEILAEILHPGEFEPGHRDRAWQWF
jgi:iron complex transport system substrate-binding protein